MAAVTTNNQVFIWGTCAASGTGLETPSINTPTLVMCLDMKDIVQVACGSSCTFARSRDGAVYSWGSGRHGILGHGSLETYEFPAKIAALHSYSIVGISTGGLHTCAWTSEGEVYSWGKGKGKLFSAALSNRILTAFSAFALGHPGGEDQMTPKLVEALANGKIILDVCCSSDETLALVEREIIEISFGDQISRLPVHSNPFVRQVLSNMGQHYLKRPEELFLLNKNGQLLDNGASIREIRLGGNPRLQLISKPSLYDYACDTLLFYPLDASSIKLAADPLPTVKVSLLGLILS